MTSQAIAKYRSSQIVLHWLVALLIIGCLVSGIIMEDLDWGPLKNQLYALHKPIGLVILMLATLRLILRLSFGAPPPDPEHGPLIRLASSAAHIALYALMFAMPVVGWAATSAFPAPLPFFGLFEVPKVIGPDRDLSKQLFEIHELMGDALIIVILAHAGAALVHHFVWKDNTLRRMT